MSLWTELQRRRVFRVAAVYAVTAWLLIQIVISIEEPLSLPGWMDTFVIVVLAIGFPVAVILSWAFDVTPDGLRAAAPAGAADPSGTAAADPMALRAAAAPGRAHWLTHAGQIVILLAVAFLVADEFLLRRDSGAPAAAAASAARAAMADGTASTGPAPAHGTQRVSIVLPEAHTMALGWTSGVSLAIAPDGSSIAYAASAWDDQTQVHYLTVRDLADREVRAFPGDGGLQPFYSPDSRWVASFATTGVLRKTSLDGGGTVDVARGLAASTWASGVWTDRDEVIIADSPGDRLYRVSANGGTLAEIPGSVNLNGARWWRLGYVPPANAVIGTVYGRGGPTIEALFLDSGERKVIAENAGSARYVASGHLVLQRGDVLLRTAVDPVTLDLIGTAVPLSDRVRMDGATGEGGVAQFDVADNGELIYLPAGEIGQRLYIVDRQGNAEPLDFPASEYGPLDVSPDGRRILSTERGGSFLLDIERGTRTALTSATMRIGGGAAWRGDGGAFASTAVSPEQRALIEVGNDGTERTLWSVARDNDSGYRNLAWHANQRDVLFTRQTGADHDILLLALDAAGSKPRPLIATPASEHSPAVSPDGKWLAYASNRSGGFQIHVRRYPDGTDQVVSRGFAMGPVWSTDSSELFFQGDLDGEFLMQAVRVTDPGAGAPALSPIEPLFPLRFSAGGTRIDIYAMSGNGGVFYDVLPDGRFVMERSTDQTRLREVVLVLNLDWPRVGAAE